MIRNIIRKKTTIKKAVRKMAESVPATPIGATVVGPVADMPNYLEVQLPDRRKIKAFNTMCPPAPGLRVILEKDRFSASRMRIATVRDAYTRDFEFPLVVRHGSSHSWMGGDVTWVYVRQFLPLRPEVSSSDKLLILVRDGWYKYQSNLRFFSGGSISMASYVPATGARFVLITIDADGLLNVTSGPTASVEDLQLNDTYVPETPADESAIAVVRLIAGTRRVRDTKRNTDLYDVRFTLSGTAALPSFLDLSDTPDSYSGFGGYMVRVKPDETGLEFVEAALGAGGSPYFKADGRLATLTGVEYYPIPENKTLKEVWVYCEDPGTSGTTIIDINLDGVTVFTNQANRPQLAWNYSDQIAVSGVPDITALTAGSVLSWDIDQVAAGATSIYVVPVFESDGGGGYADAPYITDTLDARLTASVILGAAIATGLDADAPSGVAAGRLYLPTDGLGIYRSNGAVPKLWGPIWPLTPPILADFTWVNQDTSTATQDRGAITLVPNQDNNLHLLVKSVPTAPYKIKAAFISVAVQDYNAFGLCWVAADGKIHAWYVYRSGVNRNVVLDYWTSASVVSGNVNSPTNVVTPTVMWLGIEDDGTNRKVSISSDGYNWLTLYSMASNTHFTPDRVGVVISNFYGGASIAPIFTWLHWLEE